MGAIKKLGDIRTWGLFLVYIACIFMFIYKADKFDRAATTERTTITLEISMKYMKWYALRANYYTCTYSFEVGGDPYSGFGDCPQQYVDEVKKGMKNNIVVYYDPSNPSLNSLMEFRVASESFYRNSVPWIMVLGILIAFAVLGVVLSTNGNRGKGGVVIDARGTILYPEDMDFYIGFGGVPSGSRSAEKSNSAVNDRVTSVAEFTPLLGLREIYLEVIKQIHPDRASDEFDLALRERLTKEANAAFKRCDTAMLQNILKEYRKMSS
ncbi:MAG: hypothetical protein WAN35_00385 [Terracidiphilus sp.]